MGPSPSRRRGHPLTALARQSELHHAARVDLARARFLHPDICVFDLDPSREDSNALRGAALALRDLLDELGLQSWVKTSGSKGFHIVVPLDAKADFGAVHGFAIPLAPCSSRAIRNDLTQEFSKADRGGRILVDTGRNGYSATFAAPYAVRAKPGAPISAPCTWEEVEKGEVHPQTFTMRTVADRINAVGDLWTDMRKRKYRLSAGQPSSNGKSWKTVKGSDPFTVRRTWRLSITSS